MNNRDQDNKAINAKIAENEAKRTIVSQIRVSTWAVFGAMLVAVIVVLLYLTR